MYIPTLRTSSFLPPKSNKTLCRFIAIAVDKGVAGLGQCVFYTFAGVRAPNAPQRGTNDMGEGGEEDPINLQTFFKDIMICRRGGNLCADFTRSLRWRVTRVMRFTSSGSG